MEGREWLWYEVEGGVYVLGPQEDTPGYIAGQDQMELCSGDLEQGLAHNTYKNIRAQMSEA